MSKRPPDDEEVIKKRPRRNSEDDISFNYVKNNLDYLFSNFDIKLLNSLQHLRTILYTDPFDIKSFNKEAKKKIPLIQYLLELKIDENSNKYSKLLAGPSTEDESYFKQLSFTEQNSILSKLETIKFNESKKPYMMQVFESNMPDNFKIICLNKINQLKLENSHKLTHWIESFLKLPFNTSSYLPVTIKDGIEPCRNYMKSCESILNKCVYGMNEAKGQLMQLIGKWITNPDSVGTAIGLKGPMGTGKTTLVKHGVSKLLNREFAFISLGGAMDGATLKGHSYTYEGGTYGKIADILIQCKTNNPVIFFDELDKVSQTDKGQEIIGILTHLTDTTQNSEFHDDYFSEIHLDLSKCLFVFSYNDEELVNPILKDRMYTVDIPGYNTIDKICISKKHLIPEIEKDLGLETNSIYIQDKELKYLIERTREEQGVRNLKRNLETIYSKLNLFRILKETTLFKDMIEVVLPFEITENVIETLIKVHVQKQPNHNLSMYI